MTTNTERIPEDAIKNVKIQKYKREDGDKHEIIIHFKKDHPLSEKISNDVLMINPSILEKEEVKKIFKNI